MTTNKFQGRHEEYTDKYFHRSRYILQQEGINPIVRYQVFAREDIESLVGVDEAVDFIKKTVGTKVRVYALKNQDSYKAKEPLLKLEGRVQDLVGLETVYLEILSGALTGPIDLDEVRSNARAIKQAAGDKPVYYFGARHFHFALDEQIAKICQEEGFAGCSTDIGAKAWNSKGIGTTPHALILSYAAYMHEQEVEGNPTVEAGKGFDRYIESNVPRILLIDTYNREISDTIAAAKEIPNLQGIRIDTCGENYAEGSEDIELPDLDVSEKYLRGKGVKIAGVWALRRGLDKAGLSHLEITVSSGFNAEKTAAFMEADKAYQELYNKPLFDSIGTGSLVKTVTTTSDIIAYYNQTKQQWIPMSKKGRGETKARWE
jgi:nicotinate phosphoribosyltransferase